MRMRIRDLGLYETYAYCVLPPSCVLPPMRGVLLHLALVVSK